MTPADRPPVTPDHPVPAERPHRVVTQRVAHR